MLHHVISSISYHENTIQTPLKLNMNLIELSTKEHRQTKQPVYK